ncbi:hypothetical protein DRN58_03885, partial [Thermococci archaeon]
MKKWIVILIGIVLILSVFYFPEKNKSTQSTYVLPVSQLKNIEQTKYLYYNNEIIGVINYSYSKLEILLYYDPSRFIASKENYTVKRPLPYFKQTLSHDIGVFVNEYGKWYSTNQIYADKFCNEKSGYFFSKARYTRLDMSILIDGKEYEITPFSTCSFVLHPITYKKSTVNTVSLRVDLYYDWTDPSDLEKVASKEFPFKIKVPDISDSSLIIDKTTPTSITFRSNIENFLQYYNVEIYDKNSFTKLDKPITQDTIYTFTISELTPDTEYRIVYGNKEIFVTTPKEQETLDIIPLGTEKTSNSFVQVYKVTGENVNQKIQLKHGDKVWNYEPQFDGKNYYVVFDGLETGDYEYTITVYNATEEKRYSNSFHIQNVENTSGIDLDVEPAKIDQNSFYLRFRVKGTEDYEAYFEYLNEDTFEVQEAEINHGVRYDDVYLKNLEEGDYSYNLIISTEEGTIEHKGT